MVWLWFLLKISLHYLGVLINEAATKIQIIANEYLNPLLFILFDDLYTSKELLLNNMTITEG